MSKRLFILIVLLFFGLNIIHGQDSKAQLPLKNILTKIKQDYGITFSYADANINKVMVSQFNTKQASLNNIISHLENETGLIFEKLDSNNYTIRKTNFSDITKTQYLQEVLLTNYLTEGITLNDDGTTSLNLNSFGLLPGLIEPDVLQSVQALPGIMSVDERVSNLNIRGGTNDQNLILWDGVKMYQSGHFFGLISPFNAALIDHVIITKNGSSSKYGDGVSGIIDMQTSNINSEKFNAEVGANLIAADGFFKVPISKKIEFQFAARRSLTDLFESSTYKQYSKRIFQDSDLTNTPKNISINKERFYFYDLTSKIIYDISKNDKLTIGFLNIDNALHFEEFETSETPVNAGENRLTQSSLSVNTTYSRNWNKRFKTLLQAYFSNYDLYANNQNITTEQELVQENEVRDNGLKFQAVYNIENNLNYSGGYQFSEVGIGNLEDAKNPDFRRYVKEVIRTHSIFNELMFKSNNEQTRARIGLRANYFEKFSDFLLEPRISFNQKFLNHFRLEVLAEIKSQTTSQVIDLQNDFLGIEKRRWVLSNNEDIPIIKSQQLSTGIHYNKNNLLISLEGYLKYVDGITSRSQGFQNQYQFTNTIGSYNVKGIDFLINKRFKNISTWLGYSYSNNSYNFSELNNGKDFPNNLDIRHQLTIAGTYTLNRLKMSLGFNWHSGRPTTQISNNNTIGNVPILYNSPNSDNLSDYWRSDFSATYSFKLSSKVHAYLGASVWNIFNTKNIINSYYTRDNNNTIVKIDNYALGTTPNLSFRVKL